MDKVNPEYMRSRLSKETSPESIMEDMKNMTSNK